MKPRLLFLVAMLLIVFTYTLGFPAPASTPYKLPPFIAINTLELGTSGFTLTSFASEAITQLTGQKFRILPATTDVGRVSALRSGAIHFTSFGMGGVFASAGKEEFSDISWGPQDLCIVWCAAFPGWVMVVRGDSGIKKPADLRGKRVAFIPGYTAMNVQILAHLAFGGLSPKDVEIVKVSSSNAACEGVLSGTIDTFNTVSTSSFAYRLQSSSHGLGYIAHPFDDLEGWKRAREVFPFWAKYTAVTGAGLSKEKPLQTSTNANPLFVTYANQDPDLVYWLTKNLAEAYLTFSQKAEIMKTNWTLDWNLELIPFTCMPVHPGSIRYLKEIGKWTPQLEALNQERLQNRKTLIGLWNEAVEKAKNAKVKNEDFPAFWEKMRAAAGPKYAW